MNLSADMLSINVSHNICEPESSKFYPLDVLPVDDVLRYIKEHSLDEGKYKYFSFLSNILKKVPEFDLSKYGLVPDSKVLSFVLKKYFPQLSALTDIDSLDDLEIQKFEKEKIDRIFDKIDRVFHAWCSSTDTEFLKQEWINNSYTDTHMNHFVDFVFSNSEMSASIFNRIYDEARHANIDEIIRFDDSTKMDDNVELCLQFFDKLNYLWFSKVVGMLGNSELKYFKKNDGESNYPADDKVIYTGLGIVIFFICKFTNESGEFHHFYVPTFLPQKYKYMGRMWPEIYVYPVQPF